MGGVKTQAREIQTLKKFINKHFFLTFILICYNQDTLIYICNPFLYFPSLKSLAIQARGHFAAVHNETLPSKIGQSIFLPPSPLTLRNDPSMKQKRWQLVYLSATHPTTEKIALLLFALVHVVAAKFHSAQKTSRKALQQNRTTIHPYVLITYLCVCVSSGVTSKAGVCATRNSRFHSISSALAPSPHQQSRSWQN
jgi:hypothetical protein